MVNSNFPTIAVFNIQFRTIQTRISAGTSVYIFPK